MPDITFKPFNPATVALDGTNLIEASAGTGKTYSIAILALRLLLEKQLTVKEILMVTFTKAAVAELEERIRLFIREAYRSSEGETITDDTIAALVGQAIDLHGQDEIVRTLREAVLFLDETSVLTIHSFCQQTLNEFAFETRQLFGAELVQDTSGMLMDELNKFWRGYITSIPTKVLGLLIRNGLSRENLKKVVDEHIQGKRFLIFNPEECYDLKDEELTNFHQNYTEAWERADSAWERIVTYVRNNPEEMRQRCDSNSHARKNMLDLYDQPEALLEFIENNSTKKYIEKTFPEILVQLEEYNNLKRVATQLVVNLIRHITCFAISIITKGLYKSKTSRNQMAFDDLIGNLHVALVKTENPVLVSKLQQKYKAVFIDEFQDTDRYQYEIFNRAFGTETILFYIGDPKQSIYAWRKADIETYFEARRSVANVYGMNRNFRSSKSLIEAMNSFFLPEENFDTFHFAAEDSAINYIPVESPEPNTKGELVFEGSAAVPVTITELANKDSIAEAVAQQVLDLLSNRSYTIYGKEKRKVRPSDIGILVRTGTEGATIKNRLAALGIPAVTIGDARVLNSEESSYVLYLLEAMENISTAAINKALLSPFTGYLDFQILQLDDQAVVELFRRYKNLWEDEGIYPAMNAFIADFGVNKRLLDRPGTGERSITNLYQLVELLHKVQSRKRFSSLELISWLKRGIEGMETEGDEYVQRIESDEECVNIVTIHKSKGLEYKIVLAPYLDLKAEPYSKITYWSFRDPDTGQYVGEHKNMISADHHAAFLRQTEQENRRLIYVAITRAVYKCFIYRVTRGSSSLSYFVEAIKRNLPDGVQITTAMAEPEAERYERKEALALKHEMPIVDFDLLHKNWVKMSYSRLRADHNTSIKLRANEFTNNYDRFIFSELKAGAKTGNMLHYIFENIAFDNQDKWDRVIRQAVLQFYGKQEDERLYALIFTMLEQVLGAAMNIDGSTFSLNEIDPYRRINEFEFDFNVSPFRVPELKKLSTEGMDIEVRGFEELEGIMNGKIDLFFEHQGKYYVLDWKSNFLGDSIENYNEEALQQAMNENNYHLQYLIYTLAAKKYLESRIPDFDYETQFGGVIYLFVRGVRKDGSTGVFKTKPSVETIRKLGLILTEGGSVGLGSAVRVGVV
ncbi:exodeoxyribonuclease V subunit beta [Desertivirga arenae]|uniref:exodeoxyribonuclease V subunit beta n=1 Tax=Desertivirga arenae TaxID=2810309 RepID=UPI001A9671CD|nr:exodeoxyribonuclease V subunit beta [Pedobacter sp. SYSU D00823]